MSDQNRTPDQRLDALERRIAHLEGKYQVISDLLERVCARINVVLEVLEVETAGMRTGERVN